MNGFSTLTKFYIKQQFKPKFENKKEKNKFVGMCVLLCVCFLLPMIMLCYLIYGMTGVAYQNNILPQFLSMIFFISQIAVIVFGISAYLQIMYFSKDNEFLLTLPLKQTDVYLSKLVSVLLSQMLISTLIILPSSIVMIVALVKIKAVITPVFYIMIPIAIVLMPLLPVLFISILSFPIAKIITYFQKHPLVGTIVSALLVCGILCAIYIPLYSSSLFQHNDQQTELIPTDIIAPIANIGKYSFHTFVFAKAMLNINVAANFFTFLAITLAAFGVGVGLSVLFYRATIKSIVEGTGIVVKNKKQAVVAINNNIDNQTIALANESDNATQTNVAVDMTANVDATTNIAVTKKSKTKQLFASDTYTYMKKEFKTLARNTSLSITSIMNIILAPVMLIVMSIAFGGQMSTTQSAEDIIIVEAVVKFVSIMMVTMLIGGANNLANLAFSREGEQLCILKTLPVAPKNIINAKLFVSDIASFVGSFLCAIVLIFSAKLNVIDIIGIFVFPTILSMSLNALSIKNDLKKPNTHWLNIKELSHKTKSPLFTILLASICGVLTFLAGMLLAMFIKNKYVVSAIYWSIWLAFTLGYYFLFRFKIVEKCENIFNSLEF